MNGTGGGNASAGMQFMSAIAALFLRRSASRPRRSGDPASASSSRPARNRHGRPRRDGRPDRDPDGEGRRPRGDQGAHRGDVRRQEVARSAWPAGRSAGSVLVRGRTGRGGRRHDRPQTDLETGIGLRQVVDTVSGKPLLLSLTSKSVANTSRSSSPTVDRQGPRDDSPGRRLCRQGADHGHDRPADGGHGAECSGGTSRTYEVGSRPRRSWTCPISSTCDSTIRRVDWPRSPSPASRRKGLARCRRHGADSSASCPCRARPIGSR